MTSLETEIYIVLLDPVIYLDLVIKFLIMFHFFVVDMTSLDSEVALIPIILKLTD